LKKEIQKDELTFEQTQYSSMADKLEVAMYGFTTDEDSVYSYNCENDLCNYFKTICAKNAHTPILIGI
jgi:hypothetical protein